MTIARHLTDSTIHATAQHRAIRRRRAAVRRFTATWSARINRHAPAFTAGAAFTVFVALMTVALFAQNWN
jgi:hypothetical protein